MYHRPTPGQLLATHAQSIARFSIILGSGFAALIMLVGFSAIAAGYPWPLMQLFNLLWLPVSQPLIMLGLFATATAYTLRYRAPAMMNGVRGRENLAAIPGALLVSYGAFYWLGLVAKLLAERLNLTYCM